MSVVYAKRHFRLVTKCSVNTTENIDLSQYLIKLAMIKPSVPNAVLRTLIKTPFSFCYLI